MNKKLLFIAAAVLLVGAFSANTYMDSKSPTEAEYSILTPASEIELAEDGSVLIEDGPVALGDEPPAADPNEHPNIQQIVDLVNAERAKAGLAPFVKDPIVCQAAAIRAEEIYTSFSHDRPDGSKYKTALDQVGASYRGSGENVAYGYRTADAVMNGWMNSEGHKSNILHEKFTTIGVGYYVGSNGYCYWAQMFTY